MSKLNITTEEAIAQIRLLIAEIENLKKSTVSVNKANAESFERLDSAVKNMRNKIQLMANQMNYLKAIIAQNTSATNQNTTATNNNAKAINSATSATNRNTTATKNNVNAKKTLSSGINVLTGSVNSLLKAFGVVAGVQLFANILKDVYENIKTFDSLNFALEKITVTTLNYENSQKFLLQLTRDYGVELVATTGRWMKFLAAAEQSGLSLRETEDIFRSMTKSASVLGLRTDELAGVYLALEQMLSKGKVTTEELRRQLGERLPGAMGIMAASMGKTIPELDEMLKKGEVLSAEVLPNFARAVEQAYGIENVERINTMVSAQNRLITSWQTLIKNVTEGDGVIKKFITGTLNLWMISIEQLNRLVENDNQEIRRRASVLEEKLRLERQNLNQTKALNEEGFKSREDAESQFLQAQSKLKNTHGKEERVIQQKIVDDLQAKRIEANRKAEAEEVAYAQKVVGHYEKQYKNALEQLTKFKEELAKPVSTYSDRERDDFDPGKFRFESSPDLINESEEDLKGKLVYAEAYYNYFRKMAQVSDVNVLSDDDEKRAKIIMRVLNEIYDLKREIEIGIIEKQIQLNNELIESDRVGGTERAKLLQKNAELRNRISEIEYDIAEEKARIHRDKEIKSIKKSLSEGKLLKEDANNQISDLNKEYDQKIILAAQKRDEEIFDNAVEAQNDLLDLLEDTNQKKLSIVQDPYNLEIIEAKRVYNESKKTKEDQIKLENELKRIAIESANAQIRAKIALLRASINVSEQSQEAIDETIRKINELEASLQTFTPDDTKDWKEYFMSILDYAKEFNQALGDLVNAFHERTIENINAEIEAERKKYDALIALAEGDDEQQAVLERNKEKRIEELEAKRLKAEQKQARARKAFAIADIAINTAAAIMSIWAQVPKFDFGISAGAMTAFVSALGAVQIAAVLASPIPQYAEGGKITKDEVAMINDANAKEYVQRGNQILTTSTKNAIVDLKAGDVVYKDYDDMSKNSDLFKHGFIQAFANDKYDYNKLSNSIHSGINKGFKKVKIQPIIKIDNSDKKQYVESLSRWN